MKDYFFNSYPRSRIKNSQSQQNIFNNNRPSLFNLSGSQIINNNYVRNNKKNSITSKLKNNNLLAHKQLDEINNEYNNMKDFLNNKVSKLEEQQQMQFENLKNFLEEKNLLEEIKQKERFKNNLLNDIKSQMADEYYRQKDLDNIRKIEIEEELGKRKANEKKEIKNFIKEMDYFKKIQYINQMERMLLQKQRMQQRINDMYKYRYYPSILSGMYNMNNISPFISPLLLDLFNKKENDHQQNELMKLFLLKSLMSDDNSKKERAMFSRPPKYFIQKYYPPNSETKLIPVPQPVFFQTPEPPTPSYPPPPNIIIEKEPNGMISPKINIITRDERRIKRTEKISKSKSRSYKKKHKPKPKHKHKKSHITESKSIATNNKKESEPEKSDEDKPEENEETEKSKEENPEEDEKEDEKPEEKKDDDESSQPDVVLNLVDPDHPENNKQIHPVINQQ